MAEVAANTQGSGFRLPGLGQLSDVLRRGDLALALLVMTILVVLILPLPPLMLDFALAVSIILSVLILMTSLFIQAPLEFSAFPTVLLISTMFCGCRSTSRRPASSSPMAMKARAPPAM
jgi:flagellar biosynthesis protein FlhA